MGDWEINEKIAQNLLCSTFPDIFKKENYHLCISNGIEALNIVAYGSAGLVDKRRKRIFRVGEPQILRSTLEEFVEGEWVPLVFPPIIEKFQKLEISSIFNRRDIPLVFDSSISFSKEYTEKILKRISTIDTEYVVVWDKYLGELFWEYFTSLSLRAAGIVVGHAGLTHADLHGYYLPDFKPPVEFPYQWSIFMFHVTRFLYSSEYFVYGKRSEVINVFSNEVKTLFENCPVGIVVEAESSAYRARTYSKNAGIGQLKKYLNYDYQVGYVTGPGIDEQSILSEEKANIGAISSDLDGTPIFINPFSKTVGQRLSRKVYDFIVKFISAIKDL